MACSRIGGLSGAFIPVSEDAGMIDAAKSGALCIEKLEAMTAVCSVGLDMICIPGDTPADTISAIIADEAAIGMVNNKTTAVRVIPAIGKGVGEELDWGGLFGCGPVMPLKRVTFQVHQSRRTDPCTTPFSQKLNFHGGRAILPLFLVRRKTD